MTIQNPLSLTVAPNNVPDKHAIAINTGGSATAGATLDIIVILVIADTVPEPVTCLISKPTRYARMITTNTFVVNPLTISEIAPLTPVIVMILENAPPAPVIRNTIPAEESESPDQYR